MGTISLVPCYGCCVAYHYDRVVSRHHATLARIKQTPRPEVYSYRLIGGDLQGQLHCEEIQGYWLSHPLKQEDAAQFLAQSSLRR